MDKKLLFVGLIMMVVFAGGCVGKQQDVPEAMIPEKPASLNLNVEVINTLNDSEITLERGKLVVLGISYYTSPPPQNFDADFLMKLATGKHVEFHGYLEKVINGKPVVKRVAFIGRYVEKTNASAEYVTNIGNSGDWGTRIKLLD